jgi:heterodisulfide reductase subunit A2
LVECGRHLNIELLTLSEVSAISGQKGNFSVTVNRKPRFVDMDKCIACGLCAQKCPKKVDDPYNVFISKRKAIYLQYSQTVPLKYAIDENCLYFTKGKCQACVKFCPTGAINFNEKPETRTLQVGAVIMAPGFQPFDPTGLATYGYGRIPDVVTGLEYERLLSAGGPYQGHLVRPSDHKEPQKVAWIQCVGSRNTTAGANSYCSTVCCVYAVKQALVSAEHQSGADVSQTIFYMDLRSHNKDFERYYQDAKAKGVRFIKSRPHTVAPGPNDIGVKLAYVTEDGTKVDEAFDMLILAVGLEAPKDALAMAEKLGITLDHHNFVKTGSFSPVATSRDGIYVCGAFRSPKAIPRSVTEASAAATEAARALVEARSTLTREKTYPPERDVSGEEAKIGVFVCSCGINIAGVVDVKALAEYAAGLPGVVAVENNLFTCSTDTQELISQKIKEFNLNRIVIAACTPRTHEPLFQDTLREAGLNPYLLEMANIRNQNAWVHQKEPEAATAKAKDQLRMAVVKVARDYALERGTVAVVQKALVVGGGVAGLTAALELAERGYDAVLLEKGPKLGGNAWNLNRTWKGDEIRPFLSDLIARAENHPRVNVMKNATLKTVTGSVGNFASQVEVDGALVPVEYGVAVLATGAREYQPTEYLYGADPRVMTHQQLNVALREQAATFQKADSIAFIQCVGSREPERPYCSRICCTSSVTSAIKLKELNPQMNVYVLYRDMRTYGLREELYTRARELGVIFIKFYPDTKPKVFTDGADLKVEIVDPILQMPIRLTPDYLVLAAAIIPNEIQNLVELFKASVNAEGFFSEAHPKLRPVDSMVDGLFIAGLCHHPKPLDEAISQAKAAVSRAGLILAKEVMQLDAIKSQVTEKCDGCALCLDVCPYKALKLEEYRDNGHTHRRIVSDKALCKGCGLCEATCPKEGVAIHHFTLDQLKAQVDAVLESLN